VRWLIDQCVDAGSAAQLRQSGHDVVYMVDVAAGASDADVMVCADSGHERAAAARRHIARQLVLAHALEHRLTHQAVGGPAAEIGLDHHPGFSPWLDHAIRPV
jgi:hypothetical protein